jgi:hypothetical protein
MLHDASASNYAANVFPPALLEMNRSFPYRKEKFLGSTGISAQIA